MVMLAWKSGEDSKNWASFLLPPCSMRAISSLLKASMVTERTKEMCTPRPLQGLVSCGGWWRRGGGGGTDGRRRRLGK